MKRSGINLRYLGKVIKLTSLPYIRMMFEIEAISRVIRSLYREHQKEFATEHFRSIPEIQLLIKEAFSQEVNFSMRKIRIKQLKQEEDKQSRLNAIDFLKGIFAACV